MPQRIVKCELDGCHRRRKLDETEWARLRAEGDQFGVRAGLMCPACTELVLADPDAYNMAIDMSLGEMVVQVSRADAPWRILLVPAPPEMG